MKIAALIKLIHKEFQNIKRCFLLDTRTGL